MTVILAHTSVASAVRLATTHQPERFTELYFNNHRLLPAVVKPKTARKLSFHIANHESHTVTYHYAVIQSAAAGAASVQTGTVTLASNQGADEVATYTAPAVPEPFTVMVALMGRPEAISFRSQS